MIKRLYHTIDLATGNPISLCHRCITLPENQSYFTQPVNFLPERPTTCDWCYEMFHPNLREELAQITKMIHSKELK